MSPPPEAQDLQPDDDAPAFALKDINGNWVSLRTFRKTKNVVLMAWLPTCHHCLEFLSRFNNFVKKIKGNKKIQVSTITRAVTPEEENTLRALAQNFPHSSFKCRQQLRARLQTTRYPYRLGH